MSNDKSIDYQHVGKLVEGMASVRQSWVTILMTVPGSDPLRRDFGSDLFQFLDRASNNFGGDFISTIVSDLNKWEKRCVISTVKRIVRNEVVYLYIAGTYLPTNTRVEETLNLDELAGNIKKSGSYSLAYSNAYS